ncbi:MAG: hypothetical protein WCB46_06480 [Methanoregula sp.]
MKKWNAIGILTVLVICMVFIGGCTRPVSTATTLEASPTSQMVNEAVPQQVTTPSVLIPPNGFWVKVTYSGTFSGVVGKPGLLKDVEDSGDHFYQISTADGPVWVSIRKSDGSSAELAVDVYKDGTLIKHAATTAPKGIVEFEASVEAVTTKTTATPTIVPPSGVWVKVTYPGKFNGWLGVHGDNRMRVVEDSGDHIYQINTTDGAVEVSIRISDYSSDILAVDVYKDGVLKKHDTTTSSRRYVGFVAPVVTESIPTTTVSSSIETESGSLIIHTGGIGKGVSVFIAREGMGVPWTYLYWNDEYSYKNAVGNGRFIQVEILPDGNSAMVWLPVGNYTAYLPDKSIHHAPEEQRFSIFADSNTQLSLLGYSYRTS